MGPPPSALERAALACVGIVALAAGAWRGGALALGALGQDSPAPQPIARATFVDDLDVVSFHKGNLHTHSSESDGDVAPERVYRWYRTRGYKFVALTDHNHRVDPNTYAYLERPSFKILPGEEVTMSGAGRQVHVNAICTERTIGGGSFATKTEALERGIAAIEAQGGIALVNHPNFDRSLGAGDLRRLRPGVLLEIWSGHPYVYSAGVDERPSHEALWSDLVTSGERLFAAAVDDAHHFRPGLAPGKTAEPGRAWIATYAEPGAPVSRATECDAIRRGRFYASSGASLRRLTVSGDTIRVFPSDPNATVFFLGPGDDVLDVDYSGADGASFTLRGGERWVRARVEEPSGAKAWTQAFATTTTD